jgi:hypothetical protein
VSGSNLLGQKGDDAGGDGRTDGTGHGGRRKTERLNDGNCGWTDEKSRPREEMKTESKERGQWRSFLEEL